MGAGLFLKNRPDVDPARIGLWGGSYGGYLTAMGLSRASDLFAAGVDFHGVHDWNQGIRTVRARLQRARRSGFLAQGVRGVADGARRHLEIDRCC
jgi:dipeptidyl aminopeptidase/acylaminoacyl peptidase